MCLMNYQSVPVDSFPCIRCPEHLNSCIPLILEGFLNECDVCYCEWCCYYDECLSMKGVNENETIKL